MVLMSRVTSSVGPLLWQGTVLCCDEYDCFNGRRDTSEQQNISEFVNRRRDMAVLNLGTYSRSARAYFRESVPPRG